jgi:hypothetical protein
MNAEDFVQKFYKRFWFKGLTGQIGINESVLIVDHIFRTSPKIFVEAGTASGFSTAMFAMALKLVRGEKVVTFDVLDHWYHSTAQPVGFLARNMSPIEAVPIEFVKGTSVEAAQTLGRSSVGGAFVDGSHYHPWATIDTLLLLPFMTPGGFIGHHDLNLYTITAYRDQVGPKFLYDQIPEALREVDDCKPLPRSYVVKVPNDYKQLTMPLYQSLLLPWAGISQEIYGDPRIAATVEAEWGAELGTALRP